MRVLPFLLLVMLGLSCQTALAQQDYNERIISYEAEIRVNADTSLDVTENIRFNVANQQINHGIIRNIPKHHGKGWPVRVPLRVKEVRLDGVPEPFDTSTDMGMTVIKIGSRSRTVSMGEHVYTIRYSVPRQIRRFDDFDELYWDVTGNEWSFQIDKVRAVVLLPDDLAPSRVKAEAYTGVYGFRGGDYTVGFEGLGRLVFESTRGLSYREGMTIVASFPRGQVVLDSPLANLHWWFVDNTFWVGALLLLLICFTYYMLLWSRVGRDPREGLVLREETPLIGLSPAALRYIWKMGADSNLLSAVMIQLAQKGWLLIEELDYGEFEISRTDVTEGELLPEERIFMDQIFSGRKSRFEIDRKNYATISVALSEIGDVLNRQLHHVYFERNSSYIGRGFWFCLFGFLVYLLLGMTYLYLPNYVVTIVLGFLLIVMMVVFAVLMPSYTALGRAVLDRIEGFRLAMLGGEDSFGQYVYADTVLSERYLAHAVALDVNRQWGEKIAQAMAERGQTMDSPGWYRTRHGHAYMYNDAFDYGSFSERMPSSFSSSVSTSASPPSSSSGSSGGGFSGGGGGGGGGSGW